MNFRIERVLVPQGEDYETSDVQITNGKISSIVASEASEVIHQTPPTSSVYLGHNNLLLPGFVSGHTHSSQVWQRGLIPQLPLELWLADVYDSTATNLEQLYLSALSTAVDTLLLVLGRPTDVVERVWVNGKPLVEDGKVLTVDVSALTQELSARRLKIQ